MVLTTFYSKLGFQQTASSSFHLSQIRLKQEKHIVLEIYFMPTVKHLPSDRLDQVKDFVDIKGFYFFTPQSIPPFPATAWSSHVVVKSAAGNASIYRVNPTIQLIFLQHFETFELFCNAFQYVFGFIIHLLLDQTKPQFLMET